MKLAINLNLDLSETQANEISTIAAALDDLGLLDISAEVKRYAEVRCNEERAAERSKDPVRLIAPGIWRDRSRNLREVTANTTGYGDGLPWVVDGYYTVDDNGYVYGDCINYMDLLEKVA